MVAPPDGRGAALLLARAATPEQAAHVGDQTGGRVALFLHTDDFWDDYRHMQAHGVRFAEAPREERYGRVVVFYRSLRQQVGPGAAQGYVTPPCAYGGTVTDIAIQPLTAANQTDLNRCDNSFTVEAELHLTAEDGRISYTVEPVTPYVKRYGPEIYDAQAYIEKPDHAAWLAYVDGRLAGQILVHENWNRFAIIWDIAVDPPFRRRGIGRRD